MGLNSWHAKPFSAVHFGGCGTLSSTHPSEEKAANPVKLAVKSSAFDMINQLKAFRVIEDKLNIPWQPLPAERISSPKYELSDVNNNILSSRDAIFGPRKVRLQ